MINATTIVMEESGQESVNIYFELIFLWSVGHSQPAQTAVFLVKQNYFATVVFNLSLQQKKQTTIKIFIM